MNRLLLCLLGLILLGLLAFFCVRNHAPAIEEDLSNRASAALNDERLNWVQSSIEGRELKLTGTAPSAELRERAGKITAGISGVDNVDNQIIVHGEHTAFTPSAGKYQTQFMLTNGNLVLQGMVPDLKTREQLVTIATQRFGSDHVTDHLSIQSTAPKGWKQVAQVALSQLKGFKKGSAQIIDNKLYVTGTTATNDARTQIKSAINNALPSDFQTSFDIMLDGSALRSLDTKVYQQEQQLGQAATSCQHGFNNLLSGQHILFKLNSDIINIRSNYLLNKLIKVANSCPNTRIEIGGHTDSQGSDAYNAKLSRRRAKAVTRYLSAHGIISENRLSAVGYGESSPIADNQSVNGRAKNRRIEFKVVGN